MKKFIGTYDKETTEELEKIFKTTPFTRFEIENLYHEVKDVRVLNAACIIAMERHLDLQSVIGIVRKPFHL